MQSKGKIRIIKRGETRLIEKTKVTDQAKSTREAAREAVTTVKSWVGEFQQKRVEETKKAFQQLFPDAPKNCADCG